MASCEGELWDFLRTIEPTPRQKAGAQRSHNFLRDILCSGQFASRIQTSYLSGSYARDTALAPLDDVDVIFVVDPHAWPIGLLASTPSPSTVLESFARAVRYRYFDSSVRIQRRSICLHLNHLDIDVVPAIEADAKGNIVWVPDSISGNWIKSAPKYHSEKATEINQRCNGRFKPLVKLLKYWNSNLPSTANLKSFAVETMVARLFNSISLSSLEDGLTLFFDFVASLDGKSQLYHWSGNFGMSLNWWATEVPDLAGTGSNLVANVDAERRQRFVEHATRSRDRMAAAKWAPSIESAWRRIAEVLRIR